MARNTAILIAAVGVILSLCVGVLGGLAGGFFAIQYAPRISALEQAPSQTFPLPSQINPANPNNQVPRSQLRNRLVNGAEVTQVTPDSPAAKAGLQVGDVITSVGGQAVDANHTLADLVAQKKPGDTVELKITRNGQSQTLSMTLGANPSDSSQAYMGITFTPAVGRNLPGTGS